MKIDYRKEKLYSPPSEGCTIVDVPGMNFLMVDGRGNPNTSQQYKDALEALYSLSYTIKFMIKKGEKAVDYGMPPLEGLWWTDDASRFSMENKDGWNWTSMVMQPEFVTEECVGKAIEQVKLKKGDQPGLSKLRFESYNEGLSAQIMHIGPYCAEGPTVEKLHLFIKGQGYNFNGKHHEIYLSDPRKAAPEKMKTIIRQPIVKK